MRRSFLRATAVAQNPSAANFALDHNIQEHVRTKISREQSFFVNTVAFDACAMTRLVVDV
jgi:hypothetical protein